MKLRYLSILAMSMTAGAVTVTATPPIRTIDFSTKKPLFISAEGNFVCPAGYDMYVRRVAPDEKSKTTGDYKSFFALQDGAVVISKPGNLFIPACFAVK